MLKIAFTLCASLLVNVSVEASDWLEWRGANRDGKSSETGLLQSWPEGGPALVWQIEGVGGGYSTSAVKGDRLYLVTSVGLENEYVRALNASDGSVIWSTRIGSVGAPNQKPSYTGSRSMPTIDNDRVYAVGSDGDLVCLDLKTGKTLWHIGFQKALGASLPAGRGPNPH
jgi:outer membrane protein assembly factor BamB